MAEAATFSAPGGGPFTVTSALRAAYDTHGYVLIRNLLSQEEISHVQRAVELTGGVSGQTYGRNDGSSRPFRLCMWRHPGRDVTGAVVRLNRVAGTLEQLMGGDEIYHYHSKLIMKEARTGGAKSWHQDYGYWYYNGCLLPEMGTVFIPVDDCVKENGCLQVLTGSHRMGRIDHRYAGEQYAADPLRLEQATNLFPLHHVEMKAGDVLFFHCNLLHCSAQNDSDKRRYVLIASYNKKNNNPVKIHHHPQYTHMEKLDDSALLACTEMEDMTGKEFNSPDQELLPGAG